MENEKRVSLEKPLGVPGGLTRPSLAFVGYSWLMVLLLVATGFAYVRVMLWLATVVRRFVGDGFEADNLVAPVLAAIPAVVMVGLLWALRGKRSPAPDEVEIFRDAEPVLFQFIDDIADEVGASRPHRVFLSTAVNAGVFAEAGLVNLLWPAKKNLVLGLGLINALSLSELRAVLAHEFGHFSQRSMAVSRWAFVAESIARRVVAGNGLLAASRPSAIVQDAWTSALRRMLPTLTWPIRTLAESTYWLIALVNRALIRESERHADLVAVSVVGSDALAQALYKTHYADTSLQVATQFATRLYDENLLVSDLYALQSRHLEIERVLRDDPLYGVPPAPPEQAPEKHRLFRKDFAQPSQMWRTHPPNNEREERMKRQYIACPMDHRSAWILFADAAVTRRALTHSFQSKIQDYDEATIANYVAPAKSPISDENARIRFEAMFDRTFNDPKYRQIYLGRALTRDAATVDELFDSDPPEVSAGEALTTESLYRQQDADEVARCQRLFVDRAMLEALQDDQLESSGEEIRYRGEVIAKQQLGSVIEQVEKELRQSQRRIAARDRVRRTIHRKLAQNVSEPWAVYYRSLVALLHYAEHGESSLSNALSVYLQTIRLLNVDGYTNAANRESLMAAAAHAYNVLAGLYATKHLVGVPEAVWIRYNASPHLQLRVPAQHWAERLGVLDLPPPHAVNIQQWSRLAPAWLQMIALDFHILADVTLEVLLEVEEKLRTTDGASLGAAPRGAVVPPEYPRLVVGQERRVRMKLTNWTRFRLGLGASFAFARVAVAVVLTGLLVLGEQFVLYRHIETYNGLEVPVVVAVGSRQTTIPARSAEVLYGEDARQLHFRTTLTDGTVVEEFDAPAVNSQRMYVYNVARAAVMITERIAYNRSGRTVLPSMIPSNQHNERWSITVADVRFSAPPEQVTMGDREDYRELLRLAAAANTPAGRPVYLLHYVTDRQELALSHVRFDPLNSSMDGWIQAAPDRTALVAILSARRPRSGSLLVYEYLLRTAQGAH